MSYFNKTSENWRISQCCQFSNSALAKKYNLGTTTKTTAVTAAGKQKVQEKALANARKLYFTLSTYFTMQPVNLRSFRISSELFPCYTLDFTNDWYAEIMPELADWLHKAGTVAKQNEIRLSMHPGQFTVLGSNSSEVVRNTLVDLEYHALVGKLLGLSPNDYVMNIHLQGLYKGTHEDGIKRFSTNFQYLSDYAQQCLAVENEDKPNGYDIEHVLELTTRIPTRATLDIHHFACHRMNTVKSKSGNYKNRDVELITANSVWFKEAVKTWKNVRPLFHVSQSFPESVQEYAMKPNAHSDYLHDEELNAIFVPMLQYADFDIEAKAKELAVQSIYKFILAEEAFSGELLKTKKL